MSSGRVGLIQPGTSFPQPAAAAAPAERARYEQRARLLAWGVIAGHLVEFAIALLAGLAAGSIALIAFGAAA